MNDRMIEHHSDNQRYVLPLDDGSAAFITYVERTDAAGVRHLVLNYSEVPMTHRGQGLGEELTTKTLDALIEAGTPASFTCTFVAGVAARYEPWQRFAAALGD